MKGVFSSKPLWHKCNFRILDRALRQDSSSSGFELLVQEWGTMEEWGRGESGRRSRPKVIDILDICRQIDNYRAASYINHEILGSKYNTSCVF